MSVSKNASLCFLVYPFMTLISSMFQSDTTITRQTRLDVHVGSSFDQPITLWTPTSIVADHDFPQVLCCLSLLLLTTNTLIHLLCTRKTFQNRSPTSSPIPYDQPSPNRCFIHLCSFLIVTKASRKHLKTFSPTTWKLIVRII